MNRNPTYRIKDWEKHFENSESRKYKSLSWVPVKNKHDGKGYRRVVAHPKSVQVLCAWYLIVQVASKMPTRGVLLDDDGPITTTDLYFKTGMPESIFEIAFEVLSDSKIGWLETDSPGNLRSCPENPGETDGEQNRTEQKEVHTPSAGDSPPPPAPPADVEPPPGFPKSEHEAKQQAAFVGVTEEFAVLKYHTAVSRGFKDSNECLVHNFRSYLKICDKYEKDREGREKAQNANHARNSGQGRNSVDRNAGQIKPIGDVSAEAKAIGKIR